MEKSRHGHATYSDSRLPAFGELDALFYKCNAHSDPHETVSDMRYVDPEFAEFNGLLLNTQTKSANQ